MCYNRRKLDNSKFTSLKKAKISSEVIRRLQQRYETQVISSPTPSPSRTSSPIPSPALKRKVNIYSFTTLTKAKISPKNNRKLKHSYVKQLMSSPTPSPTLKLEPSDRLYSRSDIINILEQCKTKLNSSEVNYDIFINVVKNSLI